MLMRNAEINAIKKKKEAERIRKSLEKLNPQLAKKFNAKKDKKKK